MKQRIFLLTGVLVAFVVFGLNQIVSYADTTRANNRDGIANTRHNLSIDYIDNDATIMDLARNDYDRICVYCHTPHGANTSTNDNIYQAPLWNRTHLGNTYTTFTDSTVGKELGSGQPATQPGVSSLTCLSCHDGTLAIDSIINMPGSGMYDVGQENSQNNTFLDTWDNPNSSFGTAHTTLAGCRDSCHSANAALPGTGAPDFGAFVIGTDLTNDHPIGIHLPDQAELYGFNKPTAIDGNKWFYDLDSDGHADRNEIRLYDTGELPALPLTGDEGDNDAFEVECASCHDPHGVPIAGPGNGGDLARTFLRIENSQSQVCLTCHIK